MDEVDTLNSAQLIEAVNIWTGTGSHSWPARNDGRVINRFGAAVGAKLLVLIKSLHSEYYATDAHLTAPTLQEMVKHASEQFRRKHPGIAEDIVEALEWCYSFDMK